MVSQMERAPQAKCASVPSIGGEECYGLKKRRNLRYLPLSRVKSNGQHHARQGGGSGSGLSPAAHAHDDGIVARHVGSRLALERLEVLWPLLADAGEARLELAPSRLDGQRQRHRRLWHGAAGYAPEIYLSIYLSTMHCHGCPARPRRSSGVRSAARSLATPPEALRAVSCGTLPRRRVEHAAPPPCPRRRRRGGAHSRGAPSAPWPASPCLRPQPARRRG